MQNVREFFVRSGEIERGPLSRREVESLLFARKISEEDSIWMDGMGDWAPIRTVFHRQAAARSDWWSPMIVGLLVVSIAVVAYYGYYDFPGGLVQIIATIIGVCIVGIIYVFPLSIAKSRNHPNATPILIVNLFLGWTFIGWVIALAWSCTSVATAARK